MLEADLHEVGGEMAERQSQATLGETWLAQARARLEAQEEVVVPPPPPVVPSGG